jgi:cardiolipin synthase
MSGRGRPCAPDLRGRSPAGGPRRPLADTIRRLALGLGMTVLVLGGCASLPSANLLSEWRSSQAVQLQSAKGPLTAQRSKEILAALKRQVGDIDILKKHIALEEAVTGTPLTVGNRVVLLQDGPATYEAMFKAVRAATDHINLETYIIEDSEIGNRFADLLIEKQGQGVQVNLIYDSVGALGTPKSFFERLTAAGIRVLEFNPINPLAPRGGRLNHRDHRKILIADGRIAFVGGINISSVYSSGSSPVSGSQPPRRKPNPDGTDAKPKAGIDGPGWRDTHLQLEGPVVADFQKMFLESWEDQKAPALAPKRYFPPLAAVGNELVRAVGGAPDDGVGIIYLTLLSAITNAEKSIYITNAYFVPDPQLLTALTDAAKRGVDVKMILPGHTDFWAVFHAGRSHYSALLEAGVKIYERREALLHSKTAVIDGVWSCIGSANLDWRSFVHNEESNAVVLGTGFAATMLAAFNGDLAKSNAINLQDWERRPLHFRFKEMAARMWQYWL